MKILYMFFMIVMSHSLFAVECDKSYDSRGCDGEKFSLGNGMKIHQFRVIYDGDQDGVIDKYDKCLETPPKKEVDSDGCCLEKEAVPEIVEEKTVVKEVKKVRVVTLKLNFATSKYDILEDSYDAVERFADFLIEYPEFNAKVVGHTDSRDRLQKNRELSKNRASSVVDMLVNLSVERERLSFDGVAADQPIATNDTEEGRAKNRRIEVTLTKKEDN